MIVSFCNSRQPTLALVDQDTGQHEPLEVPVPGDVMGISGLCVTGGMLLVVIQEYGATNSLAVLDEKLALRAHLPLETAIDVHSILLKDTNLYVVSTGTDELLVYGLNQAGELTGPDVLWRPKLGIPRGDFHHLTGVVEIEGQLLVSGFGPREGEPDPYPWSHAEDGFVFNVTQDKMLIGSLKHPHSLIDAGDGLGYCESGVGVVHVGNETVQQNGYARGLALTQDYVFMGQSVRRGTTGTCKLMQLNRVDLSPIREVNLSEYGDEIYDLA